MHIQLYLLSIKSTGKQNYRNYTEYYASSSNQDKLFTCTKKIKTDKLKQNFYIVLKLN